MPVHTSYQRHPLKSLIYLLLLMFAGAIVFAIIGIVLGFAFFNLRLSDLSEPLNAQNSEILNAFKVIQVLSTIGTFIVPAMIFAKIEEQDIPGYLKFNFSQPLTLFLLSALVIIASVPLLEWAITYNENIHFPVSLKWLENWMRAQEDKMDDQVKALLVMHTPGELIINLFMIAIIPAIGEEFFFRGCLQTTLLRWFKNTHAAVWVTAIIFSAIHMQFLGFIPRMLLGAILGYLFVWGKSIWLPVAAHFTNNAVSVLAAYYNQKKGADIEHMDQVAQFHWYHYLLSAIFTGAILFAFYQLAVTKKALSSDGERLD
ncbi:CPBP family intramembrane metalloprotease [Pedobacter sp. HMF7647]|uniref:CPBP family intramembrane metalloprotease n=1 Tax=Hufsiella arboris TaxID=2695275 RepID=A0A7K1Y5C5_9SPHI|nr:type II CAAX endopeptidase family protein [Hufsiella arboris]MXV49796.1 CPBP family intramembrane metalloprotease [Hufsiella arboris]